MCAQAARRHDINVITIKHHYYYIHIMPPGIIQRNNDDNTAVMIAVTAAPKVHDICGYLRPGGTRALAADAGSQPCIEFAIEASSR